MEIIFTQYIIKKIGGKQFGAESYDRNMKQIHTQEFIVVRNTTVSRGTYYGVFQVFFFNEFL